MKYKYKFHNDFITDSINAEIKKNSQSRRVLNFRIPKLVSMNLYFGKLSKTDALKAFTDSIMKP